MMTTIREEKQGFGSEFERIMSTFAQLSNTARSATHTHSLSHSLSRWLRDWAVSHTDGDWVRIKLWFGVTYSQTLTGIQLSTVSVILIHYYGSFNYYFST